LRQRRAAVQVHHPEPTDRERVMFVASRNARPTSADVAEPCRLYPATPIGSLELAHAMPVSAGRRDACALSGVQLLVSLALVGLSIAVARRARRALQVQSFWPSGNRSRETADRKALTPPIDTH
jgi:hypothetical protein